MEHSGLEELLEALEKDRKIHITVVFFNDYGNPKTIPGYQHMVHNTPVCRYVKQKHAGYQACYRCRKAVEEMLIRHKKPIMGCCFGGVYEYCSPVIYQDKVIAVVFIGNLLTDAPRQRQRLGREIHPELLSTMETRFTREDCRATAGIIASYITLLTDAYGLTDTEQDPLIKAVKHYICENYSVDFTAAEIADTFGYNEKYLGRIFKARSGQSIKEFCNTLRISEAKKLLVTTGLPVTEIAGMIGFHTVSYFNYVFGKHTGMSPTQYRAMAEHNRGQ